MAAKKKSDQGKGKPKGRPTTKKQSPQAKPEQEGDLDDDFGLDDIELDPVDEAKEETPAAKPVPKTEKKPLKATSPEKEPEKKKTPPEVSKPEEKEETAEPFVFTTGEQEAIAQEEATKKSNAPKMEKEEQENKNRGGIVFLIIILLALIAIVLYFFVFKSDDSEPVKPVPVEQAPKPEPKPEPVPEPEPEPTPEPAQLYNISTIGGNYYVIIGSFFDEDLADDKAKAIVASGRNAYVIEPTANFNFHRVGIAQSASMPEVLQQRENLIEEFGETIWVIKF